MINEPWFIVAVIVFAMNALAILFILLGDWYDKEVN